MAKPTTYPLLSEVKDGTELYTQRPDAPAAPANFRFTAFMIYQYLVAKFGNISVAPQRISYPIALSGNNVTIAQSVNLPTSNALIHVYRDGVLTAWNRGVTRNDRTLTFTPALDEEFIEIIIHK